MTKTYLDKADDELSISHDSKPHIHRVVFKNSKSKGIIPAKSSLFNKLNETIKINKKSPLTYYKNKSYTIGLSKYGTIIIFVKSDLDVFPKEFLRSLRQDFKMDDYEIESLIKRLDFVELEISHKINDPLGNLEDARISYNLNDSVNRLIAFTDNSNGNLELEFKGDPETSSNLEFLLRDKLNAVLYFANLTKVIVNLTKEIKEIKSSLKEIKSSNEFKENAIIFIIEFLLDIFLGKS